MLIVFLFTVVLMNVFNFNLLQIMAEEMVYEG